MGCCESNLCNPNYKKLSFPNGTNLVDLNKENLFKRVFGGSKLNIRFEIEVVYPNGNTEVEWLSDEITFCKPYLPMKEVLIRYVAKVKKEKASKYDSIWRDSKLDPTKTEIVINFTSQGSQYVENRYKSLKQIISLDTEKNTEYFINLKGKWYKQGIDSEFMKSRRTLSKGSFSTGISTLNTLTLSNRGLNEPLTSEVKESKLIIPRPQDKSKKSKSRRKKSPKKSSAHSKFKVENGKKTESRKKSVKKSRKKSKKKLIKTKRQV